MTQIEFVAEELAVETTESQTVELSLSDLDMVGGGSAGLIFA